MAKIPEHTAYYPSDIGLLKVIAGEAAIRAVIFSQAGEPGDRADGDRLPAVLADCLGQLDEYFRGDRQSFSLPLDPAGTDFQKAVWQQLQAVPYGQTVSYLDIARRLGNDQAVRAVGAANGQNPIVIIVPCHRVIGSNGQLTGYGGGLWRKAWLLNHEKKFSSGQLILF